MGQRANLIVRATEGDELYYSHWRANTLDSDLFWGPEAATAFARAQRSVAEGAEWLDEIWAEGGAVIDHVERVVLWFGGEDVAYDVPLRRVHLALMSECWPGWEVRWAHEHHAAGRLRRPFLARPVDGGARARRGRFPGRALPGARRARR